MACVLLRVCMCVHARVSVFLVSALRVRAGAHAVPALRVGEVLPVIHGYRVKGEALAG